jgi:hypothetical protein
MACMKKASSWLDGFNIRHESACHVAKAIGQGENANL